MDKNDHNVVYKAFSETASHLSNYYKEAKNNLNNQKSDAAKSVYYDLESLLDEFHSQGKELTIEDLNMFLNEKIQETEIALQKNGR